MTKYPWRVQGDLAVGDNDPMLTVFVGERYKLAGKDMVQTTTEDPLLMKLSEFARLDLSAANFDAMQREQYPEEAPPEMRDFAAEHAAMIAKEAAEANAAQAASLEQQAKEEEEAQAAAEGEAAPLPN